MCLNPMTLTNHYADIFKHHFRVSFVRILRLREVARVTARIALEFAPEFVYVYRLDFVECYLILLVMHFSVSLLLKPLCCDDIHDVTPRVSALARLMFGSDVISHVRHSRLMDEFDKFATKEGELLESMYERLTTLVNIIDRNNVCSIPVSIKTKILNCLQPKWSKYVTIDRHNQTGDAVSYDVLYDSLIQYEPRVLASKAKKAAKNHDPLALLAQSNASSSQSHANSSYSPQPYYVTHPS
ncbi:hypothetical protein Tco_1218663 [Tanacetum coccineum]